MRQQWSYVFLALTQWYWVLALHISLSHVCLIFLVCNLYNYADDNTLLNTHHSIADLKYRLETSATVAIQWFDVNGMKSNQAKFQAMILNNQPDTSDISLCVNDMNIQLKPCVKLLGVFLDYELNFSDHVTHVCKGASRQLNAVRRVAKYLNKDCLLKLFHAFIISNFNYCAIVWHFCSKSSTIKMEKIQKAALRVVFNDYDADYNQLLSMSERSPLLVVRLRTILIEVFKCIRELNPKFMNMLFTLNNKPYDTRSGPLLFQSHVKTIKHGINSFVYQGAKRWNSLPTDAKDIECFNRFKNFLTTWMGPDCHCGYCVLCAIKTM